ncbi:MAG: PTS sugar transporter subunit IIA [Bacillota bacterium]
MKITELINNDLITLQLKSTNKKDVIRELASYLDKADKITDLDTYVKAIEEREAQGSTGVGYGVAIPHAKSASVKAPALVFGKTDTPMNYESSDNDDADLFFMIAAPKGGENLHLQTLAKLSRKLIHEEFRDALREASTKEDVMNILNKIDGKEDQS